MEFLEVTHIFWGDADFLIDFGIGDKADIALEAILGIDFVDRLDGEVRDLAYCLGITDGEDFGISAVDDGEARGDSLFVLWECKAEVRTEVTLGVACEFRHLGKEVGDSEGVGEVLLEVLYSEGVFDYIGIFLHEGQVGTDGGGIFWEGTELFEEGVDGAVSPEDIEVIDVLIFTVRLLDKDTVALHDIDKGSPCGVVILTDDDTFECFDIGHIFGFPGIGTWDADGRQSAHGEGEGIGFAFGDVEDIVGVV